MSFKAPVDEILFSLEHLAGASTLPGWDRDMLREIFTPYAALVENQIAPLNLSGDHAGSTLENGRVHLPAGFKHAFGEYAAQGWMGITIPEAYGGHGLDEVGLDGLALAGTSEILSGANHAFQMLVGLSPGLIRVLQLHGTEAQRSRLLPMIANGECLSTMALTEPQAGSDLSKIRTKATQQPDETWSISGEKIFISNGDQDASAQIAHLVLARTSDEGVKGLSLFLCLKTNEGGSPNGVSVERIEHKMGIKASPTCHLRFDEAKAEIIGVPGQGLALMFTMMNHARLDVALQGTAHAAHARRTALDYAAQRVQGGGTVSEHPGIAAKLAQIEFWEVSSRALAHFALVKLEAGGNDALISLLTPLSKVYCSEAGFQAAQLAMNVLGGYGYLEEYGLSQTLRDAKIPQIYEGTNDIHEAAVVTRLAKQGVPFDAFVACLNRNLAQTWGQAREALASLPDARTVGASFCALTSLHLIQQLLDSSASPVDTWPHRTSLDQLRHICMVEREKAQLAFILTCGK